MNSIRPGETLEQFHARSQQEYKDSARAVRDNAFREQLASAPGPLSRCFLGWAGAPVKIYRVFHGDHASCLTGTDWFYEWGTYGDIRHTSHEINFCDSDDVPELLNSWHRAS